MCFCEKEKKCFAKANYIATLAYAFCDNNQKSHTHLQTATLAICMGIPLRYEGKGPVFHIVRLTSKQNWEPQIDPFTFCLGYHPTASDKWPREDI